MYFDLSCYLHGPSPHHSVDRDEVVLSLNAVPMLGCQD